MLSHTKRVRDSDLRIHHSLSTPLQCEVTDAECIAGLSVLHYAVDGGNPDIVSMLLLTGHGPSPVPSTAPAHLGQPSSSGAPSPISVSAPLPGAAVSATGGILSPALPAAGAPRQVSAFSPVHLAARRGHAHLLPQLLRCGLDPAARDSNGRTALHHAALGYGEAATATLVSMAAIAAGAGGSRTPFSYSSSSGSPFQPVESKVPPPSGIRNVAMDHQRAAELLLLTECSAHVADNGKATALLYAAGERLSQTLRIATESLTL